MLSTAHDLEPLITPPLSSKLLESKLTPCLRGSRSSRMHKSAARFENAVLGSSVIAYTQDVARGAIASPVEHIADSLDEHSEAESGAQMSSAIKGEFGDYSFHDAQLKARHLVWISPTSWARHRS